MLKTVIRPISLFLVFSFVLLDLSVQTANGQMIDTHTVIAAQEETGNRQRVAAFLEREDVQQVLVEHGVETAEAQNRVASLSDAEITRISRQIDQLPAGGDALGTVVGAALFVFIVLLVTDLLGLTHVFSFVNHPR